MMTRRLALYGVLICGAVMFLYPFLWMGASSLRPDRESTGFGLTASSYSLEHYYRVFDSIPVAQALINSLIVSIAVTLSVLTTGALAGYALARLDLAGRGLILLTVTGSMMVPHQLLLIPVYSLIVRLGWTDSYFGLIIPFMVNCMAILMFTEFFRGIPESLVEAARIDGCTELGILWRIILPLSRPILTTVGIIAFMGAWNEVLWPLLVVRQQDMMTLPQMVTLYAVGGASESALGVEMAASFLLILPMAGLYLFLQRYFIEGIASSGQKE